MTLETLIQFHSFPGQIQDGDDHCEITRSV